MFLELSMPIKFPDNYSWTGINQRRLLIAAESWSEKVQRQKATTTLIRKSVKEKSKEPQILGNNNEKKAPEMWIPWFWGQTPKASKD